MGLSFRLERSSNRLRWLWWLSLLSAAALIALIAFGVFDSKPIGRIAHVWQVGQVDVSAAPQTLDFAYSFPEAFSIRFAIETDDKPEVGYGFMLSNADQLLGVATSNHGFVHMWVYENNENVMMPWQPWPTASIEPYVSADEPTEFWIDVTPAELTIRINRELLWQGINQFGTWDTFAVYTDGFGQPSHIDVETIIIYHTP